MKKIFIIVLTCGFVLQLAAQDNLVKSLEGNKAENAKSKFTFTPVIDVTNTSIKNQGSSGTCWSYSANSFLESEMIRMGKQPVDLAEIFTARNVYIEKAKNYVQMQGAVTWGDGGEAHDVTNMYAKYGALPQSVYTGLNYGTTKNKFKEMQDVLKGMLDGVIKNGNGKLTPNWINAFTAALDAYLGPVPEKFTYNGKEYTPKTFASEVVGINPADYIEIMSISAAPYYAKSFMAVPDNWSFDYAWNLPMNDMTTIIDNALKNGYTVEWATDVSEKYFSWKNGVAYVPANANALMDMTKDELDAEIKNNMFDGPKPELEITEQLRQEAWDNQTTTDDHGMHIVGVANDQNGKPYYIVKNSWGESNDYKGYLYVSKNYVKYKTTGIMVHKNAIPQDIRGKMKI